MGHATCRTRYHPVWIAKYRFKVSTRDIRLRIREIIQDICNQPGVHIIKGVLSADPVHMFIEIPSKHSVNGMVQRIKDCMSRENRKEFPALNKHHWK